MSTPDAIRIGAAARPGRVLMVGPALEGRGGVAAVVAVLRDAGGVFEREGVRYVSTHVDGSRAAKARRALAGLWQATCACLLARPVAVHVHSASGASFVRKSAVLLVARLAGRRTILHLHGGSFDRYAARAHPWWRRWIAHTLARSTLVIALSDGWARRVRALAPAARVAVVPNAVPLPPPAGAGDPARILFLGRVGSAKGVDELIDAAALLAPQHPDLRLVLAGDGDLDRARRRARARGIGQLVELPGWLDAGQRAAELARAAIFCLPSHAEGLPMALLEAMAAGRAVVASTVGAVPEVVQDGEDGLLVPPHDSVALAAALARLLDNPRLAARLGARARERVAAHYSLAAVGARLASIYRELEETP